MMFDQKQKPKSHGRKELVAETRRSASESPTWIARRLPRKRGDYGQTPDEMEEIN